MRRGALVGLAALAACAAGCAIAPDPNPQVIVAVDTDLPMPGWIDRLAVDVYDELGATHLEQRDYAVPSASDWPVTFGVRHETPGKPLAFRLRLRAYDSTRRPGVLAGEAGALTSGADAATPVATIERVVRVRYEGATRKRVRVVLRGDCLGVRADVATGETCIDLARQHVPAPLEPFEAATAPLAPSEIGTWSAALATPCAGEPRRESGLHDEELCIPGGAYFMGDAQVEHTLPYREKTEGAPERLAQVSPFFLDRYEVSVGRMRAAMRDATRPFVPPVVPTRPLAPLTCGPAVDFRYCTWRDDAAADELPVNCVTFETARAFCQWAGGDLPSEAQWEYAATRAFRARKSPFPWVGASPACAIASFGRWTGQTAECGHEVACGPLSVVAPFGGGPRAPDCEGAACVRDETPGPPGSGGIIGLAGNVSEWVRDLQVPYKSACWRDAPRRDPVCEEEGNVTTHMFRGGTWALASWLVNVSIRTGGIDENPLLWSYGAVGFRCMRQGTAR